MKKPGGVLLAVIAAVVLGAAVIVLAIVSRDDDNAGDAEASIAIANSFPVPAGAVQAFPDTVAGDSATKGWRAQGTDINRACSVWRDAYRLWINQGSVGSVSGDEEPGRRCTLAGPKTDHIAVLAVTVYGDDPVPQVTLHVRPE